MRYAEVAVNSPVYEPRVFTYAIPPDTHVMVGQAVRVPFGHRVLHGIVFEINDHSPIEQTRDIIEVIDPTTSLSPHQIELAKWISDYYLTPLFDAASLMLPPGFHSVKKIKPRYETYIKLGIDPEAAIHEIQRLKIKAPRQADLLEYLLKKQPLSFRDAGRNIPNPGAIAKALERKQLVFIERKQLKRDPLLSFTPSQTQPPFLTNAQENVLSLIKPAFEQNAKNQSNVFLLHGVTGSGKTEVYIRALEETVNLGKRGIVLVPEIALTPQTIRRFSARFPGRIALLHSKLSTGEQFDEWQEIKKGAFDVVIGPRGALFSPQPDLGLIVIDEEHEWTYKQQEQSPLYHAREAAVKLAELTGAVVILGSATPDIQSFYQAQKGKYRLLNLPHRVAEGGEIPLPKVELVDMRRELKAGNRSIFSESLNKAIASTLAAGEQTILFLNRRGTSTFVQCRSCGYVIKCPRCELPFTYHKEQNILTCHQCKYKKANPESCPECLSRKIKFLGTGTQKVEEEIRLSFPKARVIRWDRDVTKKKNAHERILNKFLDHHADILIGTQMIAKGLDIPSVTLVGIISADTILNFPDYKAVERTFQLLSQVAGRAGRGTSPGRVIVQTYTPEHYAISTSAKHDYLSFFNKEISYRRQYKYPPFNRIARLVYHHTSNDSSRRETEKLFQILKDKIYSESNPGNDLIGPSPAFFPKVRGRFRWQIILRGPDPALVLADLSLPHGWTVDIDPVSLL